MKLISACLVGINCRYDGTNCLNERGRKLAAREAWIPVCPEQLGGLGTPREPMRILGGGGSDVLNGTAKAVNTRGEDVTAHLMKGAEEVAKIAMMFGVREAIMKAGSPSCGCDESLEGVTTAMLKRKGIRVTTEEEL
jgi:uncharacterized protein YbbK (DUF523 family)